MENYNDLVITKIIKRAERLYNAVELSLYYTWEEVLDIIKSDPDVFDACLRRAIRYQLPQGRPKSHKLWIACNMVRAYVSTKRCYYCGKNIKINEFFEGNIHLEHFYPRSMGGEHIPINVNPACKSCNLLKRDFCEADFTLILENPQEFRRIHSSMRAERFEQLRDFAEIFYHTFKGSSWIIERFGATSTNYAKVLNSRREIYRKKWNIK